MLFCQQAGLLCRHIVLAACGNFRQLFFLFLCRRGVVEPNHQAGNGQPAAEQGDAEQYHLLRAFGCAGGALHIRHPAFKLRIAYFLKHAFRLPVAYRGKVPVLLGAAETVE